MIVEMWNISLGDSSKDPFKLNNKSAKEMLANFIW